MPKTANLLTQMKQLADDASARVDQASGPLGEVKMFILDTFGQNGLYAAYIILAAIIVLLVSKIAGVTFAAIKYMVIPGIVLAFVATFFFPYSFFTALPVTVAGCSLFLLFKG